MANWQGSTPDRCQLCGKQLPSTFVDGNTSQGWGMLCTDCHRIHGHGFGIGCGQQYQKQPDGSWLKVEG